VVAIRPASAKMVKNLAILAKEDVAAKIAKSWDIKGAKQTPIPNPSPRKQGKGENTVIPRTSIQQIGRE